MNSTPEQGNIKTEPSQTTREASSSPPPGRPGRQAETTMIAYRIENPSNHVGPFHGFFSQRLKEKDRKSWYLHTNQFPGIDDIPTEVYSDYSFACPKPAESLTIDPYYYVLLWFEDFLPKLEKEGYVLSIYETQDYVMGKSGRQMVFNTQTAVLLETKRPTEITQ
jgi:hypothetical protein